MPTLILPTQFRREPLIYACGHAGRLRAERGDSDREIAAEAYHRAQLPCPALPASARERRRPPMPETRDEDCDALRDPRGPGCTG